jgi:hypothetical protein
LEVVEVVDLEVLALQLIMVFLEDLVVELLVLPLLEQQGQVLLDKAIMVELEQ